MDVTKLPLFQALSEHMHWLGQRQDVLAQNIANLNTPGYKAGDLRESDFAATLARTHRKVTLASSSGNSIGMLGQKGQTLYDVVVDPTPSESTPSGNGVMLEDQLMKVADTQMGYQTAVSLYKKHLALIRMALGGSR